MLHSFEPMPDALAEKANGTLGSSKLLTDLPGCITLQAQFQDWAFLLIQAGKKLLDRFAQHGCLKRCRVAA
jgi:hypothetical protein